VSAGGVLFVVATIVIATSHATSAAEHGIYRVATFRCDVTPPPGHPLLAGLVPPARELGEPLSAIGLVLLGADRPIVLVAVDWCEIRSDAYDRWRSVLAEAAGTVPERVLVSSVHQHDAPLFDLRAQRVLDERKLPAKICDPAFHEQTVQNVARRLRESLAAAERVTHVGMGKARVERVASNRRYMNPGGQLAFNRTSASKEPRMHDEPEGTIDPWLKTLSFWNGQHAIAAVHFYATHPMSYYRTGRVSCDFPGMARMRRQQDERRTTQLYFTGASGNVTAGKYNDGSPLMRPILADRIYRAMVAAWDATERVPLERVSFTSARVRLEARNDRGYAAGDLEKQLAPDAGAHKQILAALGTSWRERAASGPPIDLPLVDFGKAKLLLLPAESYIEYQLLAQKLSPESFVLVAGYGQCAPGYIPTERAWRERDSNLALGDWCWTTPSAEQAMTAAIEQLLKPNR